MKSEEQLLKEISKLVKLNFTNRGKSHEFMNIANEQRENYKSFKIEINKTIEKDITDKIEQLFQYI